MQATPGLRGSHLGLTYIRPLSATPLRSRVVAIGARLQHGWTSTSGLSVPPPLPQQARQNARNGEGGLLALVTSIVGCILECVYTLIEYLTKFATIMMAINGAGPQVLGARVQGLEPHGSEIRVRLHAVRVPHEVRHRHNGH